MTSPPHEGLSRLRLDPVLDPMPPTTRSQTRRGRQQREQRQAQVHRQGQQPTAGSIGAARASSPMDERFSTISGFIYDISSLSQTSRERVRRATESGDAIAMEYCERTKAGVYVFHMKDTFAIFVNAENPPSKPRCDCGVMQEGGLACKHLYWLEDQIVQAYDNTTSVYRLVPDGSSIGNKPPDRPIVNMSPFELIERRQLSELAEHQEWLLTKQVLEEDQDREDELNHMLSVFNPIAFSPTGFVATLPDLPSPEQAYKQFCDSVIAQAMQDDGLYAKLRSIIDPKVRANVFFGRVQNKVVQAFNDLQRYLDDGPTESTPHFGVEECATKLEELVEQIRDSYAEDVEDDPRGRDLNATSRAVGALVDILQGVVDRNRDLYQGLTWAMPPNEQAQGGNLFARLIEDHMDEDDLFVLSVLKDMPPELIRNHRDRLEGTLQNLRSQGAPKSYVTQLQNIIQKRRRAL